MIHPSTHGLKRLRQDLLRRRWARLEPRLRFQLVALALLLTAFTFWQLRLLYAGAAFSRGPLGAGAALMVSLACLLVAVGGGIAVRLHRRLRAAPKGPAWLGLPTTTAELLRHQAWEAEVPLRVAFVFGAAACVAALRIAPLWVVMGAAAAFLFGWAGCSRAGAALARAIAVRPAPRSGEAPAAPESALRMSLARAWVIRSTAPARLKPREGSWRRRSVIAALGLKDFWLARRSRETHHALLLPLGLSIVSLALWSAPALRVGVFAVTLLALAAWGEWLIVLGSRDPFSVLRSLPVGPGTLWRSRFMWGATVTLLLVLAHALAARPGSALLALSITALALSGLAISALAINLQLTLFPAHAPARNLFGLGLGLAMVCSQMIPLLGWGVLLGAVIHTARRLPRWWQLEEAA